MGTLGTKSVDDNRLLTELEAVIRSMPERPTIKHETQENIVWFGRALAAIDNWDGMKGVLARGYVENFLSHGNARENAPNFPLFLMLLNQAYSDLRLKTIGPINVAVGQGEPFRYFDALRKVIELANSDLLFVDRYMGAEFVSTYLPLVKKGVKVRLLTRDKLASLASAARAFVLEHKLDLEIRSSDGFHDRWLFVDRTSCYQSGASFKDGGKNDSTTLTQNIDAFPDLLAIYEGKWKSALPQSLSV